MSCTVYRIDVEDLDFLGMLGGRQGVGTPWLDEANHRILFVWTAVTTLAGQAETPTFPNHNKGVFFRAFDYESETFSPASSAIPVSVNTGIISTVGSVDAVGFMYDDVLNDMVVVFGDTLGLVMCSSQDGGATWSAQTTLLTDGGGSWCYSDSAMNPYSRDMFVWAWHAVGGSQINDIRLYKRTNTGMAPNTTWVRALGGSLFFDGGAVANINTSNISRFNHSKMMASTDASTMVAVFDVTNADNTCVLKAFWTTDNWDTMNTTDITATFPAVGGHRGPVFMSPEVLKDPTSNRVWCVWMQVEGSNILPHYAYTDDCGQTWTLVGYAPVQDNPNWDEAFDRGAFLDYAGRMYESEFYASGLTNVHNAWRTSDPTDLSSWVSDECNLDLVTTYTVLSSTEGFTFYVLLPDGTTTKFLRCFGRGWPVVPPSTHNVQTYDLFVKTEFVPPPPPPPPPPAPDEHRMFRRGVLQASPVGIPQRNASAVRSIEEAVRPPGVN